MADLLRLPPELRVLAAHLQHDDRPCAIAAGQHELLYRNAPFRDLDLSKQTTDSLLKNLHTDGTQEGRAEWGDRDDGLKWRSTRVLDRYNTLVRTSHGSSSAEDGSGPAQPPALLQVLTPSLGPRMQFVKDFDWTAAGLGPLSSWSAAARISVMYMLGNSNPRLMIWGTARILFYNEAVLPLIGAKHPACFGRPIRHAFADIWDGIHAKIDEAMRGRPTTAKETTIMLERNGIREESQFDFSFIPVMGLDGLPVGLFVELVESTQKVRGERRRASMLHFNEVFAAAQTLDELWRVLFAGLQRAVEDVPLAMFYSVVEGQDEQESQSYPIKCVLKGITGFPPDDPRVSKSFYLDDQTLRNQDVINPCLEAWKTKQRITLRSKDSPLPEVFTAAHMKNKSGYKLQNVIVAPIRSPVDNKIFGFFLMATNPGCPLDSEYLLWTNIMTDMLTKTATLIVLPEEQRRAQRISDELNEALTRQLRLTALDAEQSEARFRRIAESAPTGMVAIRANGEPVHVNDKYLEMIGETRERYMCGVDGHYIWDDHVHPDDLERIQAVFQRIFELQEPVTVEYRSKWSTQMVDQNTGQLTTTETWFLASAFPEVDGNGNVAALLAWLMDVSHQKLSDKLVAQRLDEALENKRQTENFIDMTSHEMRNPLSAILQSADSIVSALTSIGMPILGEDMVVSPDCAEEIVDAAQTIILCAQHQKRIVDDILTLSKLDASLLIISPDPVQPPALVRKILKMYGGELRRAEIDASLWLEDSYQELQVDWIVLDSSRLLQVIINLVTNAIKFTQYSDVRKLRICLGASLRRPTGAQHHVQFIPRRPRRESQDCPDSGKGDDIYLQVAITDTGRGLSAEEMRVLFQRFGQASTKTYKQYGGSGLGLFISRELVELQGGQIGVASHPGETTFTFYVKAKRGLPTPTHEDDMRSDRNKILPIDNDPPPRPISPAPPPLHRQESLDSVWKIPATAAPVQHKKTTGPLVSNGIPDQLHVLIVEDNMVNQRVMSQQLRRADCIVHTANHGGECLSFLEATTFCSASTRLSVVLLDLEMPTMDGLTTIKHIRTWQREGRITGHVPVIAVTANARGDQIAAAISAGMDSVVTKPFRIPELLLKMKRLVANAKLENPE
ncbi:hypothetical protein LTR62_005997 [Meristemomyces frigidus]|uniref:Uncharacterized protein n=1 Tax=Meristemomyces frigidus TaxID=1508187 RepID=A0AAN7TW44_9PEZI|nr:hypothetical protein LTR62_005997 [Meristemomyces frigidus]